MLGEEFETRSKGNHIGIVLALVLAKALRATSLCNGFFLLFSYDFPVVLYTFYVLLGSSIAMLIFQRPWQARKTINPNLYLRIIAYSFLLVLNMLFWNIGLKYYGPTRAILSSDYADAALSFIFTAFFPSKGKSSKAEKTRGTLIVVLAYLLLFWTEPSYSTNLAQHFQVLPNGIPGAARYFQLGFISIPESKVGGVCLFIAICLSIIRKNFMRHLQNSGYPEIGTKRLYSIALIIGTIMMTPFGIFSAFTTSSPVSIFSGTIFFGILSLVVFAVVGDFYIESFAHQQLDMSYATKASIITSFVVASFCESVWGFSNLTFLTTLCFFLILWGMHFIYQKQSASALPVYGTPGALQAADIFSAAFFKMFFQQVLQSYESRRIFGYLCVNLTFMFVEAFYGWWTNSLGLISDACHMLFDCTALFIGLIASVISQRPSNKVFSFGYGRIEVVSGFVNAIFLMFIAITVLLESAERFFHPQEVITDKLLLVSFLGLCVNLIGVAAFHDLHGGGGDHGGHSHSHGHSHGHDHGHEKEEKSHNSNIFGVYLHIVADALGSVGVIISTSLIIWKGWTIADPICSFCISALIFVSVIPLLQSSATILLQCTPPEIDEKLEKCMKLVSRVEGVVSQNNPHFWRLSKDMVVGSIQIQAGHEANEQKILGEVQQIFKKKGKVKNMTVEIVK